MERLVMHPLVLGIAEQVLLPWCERIALNLPQAIEIHPGALPQMPHRDQDMWPGTKGSSVHLMNVLWPLVPVTPQNGATPLWTGRLCDDHLAVFPEAWDPHPVVSSCHP